MLIQKLRLQRGWSQEQLAELSGLSTRTIQRLERGHAASTESLKAIASVFEIDFTQLKDPVMDTSNSNTSPSPGDLPTDEALALAHVRRVKRFYMHALQYVGITTALAIINLVTWPSYLWVLWVAFGWGLGVIFEALSVFGSLPFLNGDWERRQVEKYLGREL